MGNFQTELSTLPATLSVPRDNTSDDTMHHCEQPSGSKTATETAAHSSSAEEAAVAIGGSELVADGEGGPHVVADAKGPPEEVDDAQGGPEVTGVKAGGPKDDVGDGEAKCDSEEVADAKGAPEQEVTIAVEAAATAADSQAVGPRVGAEEPVQQTASPVPALRRLLLAQQLPVPAQQLPTQELPVQQLPVPEQQLPVPAPRRSVPALRQSLQSEEAPGTSVPDRFREFILDFTDVDLANLLPEYKEQYVRQSHEGKVIKIVNLRCAGDAAFATTLLEAAAPYLDELWIECGPKHLSLVRLMPNLRRLRLVYSGGEPDWPESAAAFHDGGLVGLELEGCQALLPLLRHHAATLRDLQLHLEPTQPGASRAQDSHNGLLGVDLGVLTAELQRCSALRRLVLHHAAPDCPRLLQELATALVRPDGSAPDVVCGLCTLTPKAVDSWLTGDPDDNGLSKSRSQPWSTVLDRPAGLPRPHSKGCPAVRTTTSSPLYPSLPVEESAATKPQARKEPLWVKAADCCWASVTFCVIA